VEFDERFPPRNGGVDGHSDRRTCVAKAPMETGTVVGDPSEFQTVPRSTPDPSSKKPLPVSGRREVGQSRKRERSDQPLQSILPDRPPMAAWGRSEQKNRSRFLQRTDQRSGMNGHGTPGPGGAVAGERPASGIGAVPEGKSPSAATERLASGGKPARTPAWCIVESEG